MGTGKSEMGKGKVLMLIDFPPQCMRTLFLPFVAVAAVELVAVFEVGEKREVELEVADGGRDEDEDGDGEKRKQEGKIFSVGRKRRPSFEWRHLHLQLNCPCFVPPSSLLSSPSLLSLLLDLHSLSFLLLLHSRLFDLH